MQKMNSLRKWLTVGVGIVVALLAFVLETQAQSHEGFIYGKVTLRNNTSYTGPLRWGNEEVLWTDLFNTAKTDDPYKKLVPKDRDNESWFDGDWSLSGIWADKASSHRFTCQFGNLVSIEPKSDDRALVTLKNGLQITVNGEGYNDLDATIQVIDPELGVVRIEWDRIRKIEFSATPAKLESTFGLPIYGTVEGARREKYTGYIVWDEDERLAGDKLDGDSDNGKVALRFGDIQSIEKSGDGSTVITKQGRRLHLTGSNDVNDENRGVLVVDPQIGVIRFTWDAFRKVTFSQDAAPIQRYDDFKSPRPLMAHVIRFDTGEDVYGRVVYDIDEWLDLEVLEGRENNVEYIIPMKNVKKIAPRNADFSEVTLRNGNRLLIGDSQDVSSSNSGVLVFVKGKKDPVHISWKKVDEITFD
jgi:hypothetical protein